MVDCKRIGAALAALFFCVGALAQEGAPPIGHFYAGGGAGQAHWRPGCPGTVPDCDDTNTSVHVFGGYQLNRVFAGEIAFTNYGKANGTNMEVKGRGWEASALAAWPVHGPVSVFGRLGIFRSVVKGEGVFAKDTESSYGPTYGVGVQTDLTANLGARLEWQAFSGVGGSTITRSDVNIVSVSALWRFR